MKESTSLRRYFNGKKRWDWKSMTISPSKDWTKRSTNHNAVKPITGDMNYQSNSNPCSRGQRLWVNWPSIHPFTGKTLPDPKPNSARSFASQEREITSEGNWRKIPISPFMSLMSRSIVREKWTSDRMEQVLQVTTQLESQSKRAEGDPIKRSPPIDLLVFWYLPTIGKIPSVKLPYSMFLDIE